MYCKFYTEIHTNLTREWAKVSLVGSRPVKGAFNPAELHQEALRIKQFMGPLGSSWYYYYTEALNAD